MSVLTKVRHWGVMSAFLLALVVGGAIVWGQQSTAEATTICGTTLTGGTHVLADDLFCPGGTIVLNGAHLDLNGKTLSFCCASFGILMTGTGSHVNNGTVLGARNTIVLNTGSGHKVSSVVVGGGGDQARIWARFASDNKINGNTVSGGGWGILVGSQNNKISGNTASGASFKDMRDSNANCDNNKWRGNTFGTSEADTVVSPACIR